MYPAANWRANTDRMPGHVNNVVYNRYAESARVNWVLNFAASDPGHKAEWKELIAPTGIGLILRSIRTDYKFVRSASAGHRSYSPVRRRYFRLVTRLPKIRPAEMNSEVRLWGKIADRTSL